LLSFEFVPPLMGRVIGIGPIPNGARISKEDHTFCVNGIGSKLNKARISKKDHAFCVDGTGSKLNGARKGKEDHTFCCKWNWFQSKWSKNK
jgi:hypothetical protein